MNNLHVDMGCASANKFGETLCGDHTELIRQDEGHTTLVLADGLGSGVKASILSTLTAKIIGTMMAGGMSLEDCVRAVADTLPICRERGIAYSTFTIVRVDDSTEAELIQFDNPMVIWLRDGKSIPYEAGSRVISGKTIYESRVQVQLGDVFVAMSDGAIYAGVGKTLNYGWQRDNIIKYLEENYEPSMTAKMVAALLLEQCQKLYVGQPGDDTTLAAVKIWERRQVNLLIGPPADPADVSKMMSLFFSKEGKHIVCGGTTSILAARYLGKEIRTVCGYVDPSIPPIAEVEGIDLVTEGVLTVNRVLQYAKEYLEDGGGYPMWVTRQDGASLISRLLFSEATDINFYVGRAVNSAHQNPDLPVSFRIKIQLINELAECLQQMGKRIKISYF